MEEDKPVHEEEQKQKQEENGKDTGSWIFLSHSSKDYDKVRMIRNEFEEQGHNPLAFYLKCITDDSELEDLLKREIQARDWFVYCKSKNAEDSKYVREERDIIHGDECKRLKEWEIDLDQSDEAILEQVRRISKTIKIFVPYTYKDKALIEPLIKELNEHDYHIVMEDEIVKEISNGDHVNYHIVMGDEIVGEISTGDDVKEYFETVKNAMVNCKTVLFIFTSNTREFPYNQEDLITFANKNGCKFIIILVDIPKNPEYYNSLVEEMDEKIEILIDSTSKDEYKQAFDKLDQYVNSEIKEDNTLFDLRASNPSRQDYTQKFAYNMVEYYEELSQFIDSIDTPEGQSHEQLIQTKEVREKYAEEQYKIGRDYYFGRVFQQSYKDAVKWYNLSANEGNAEAQNALGICYSYGLGGLTRDYEQAVKWYEESAKQGNDSAQNNLGLCYLNGQGVAQNYRQAFELLEKAANQDNSEALYNLGVCYEKGLGATQDIDKAIDCYSKSKNLGYEPAKKRIDELLKKD